MQFLINTFTHWDEPPRARHQVAYALSKKYKVVFVAANKFGFPGIKYSRIHENLEVITPYFPIGNKLRWRLRIINESYQNWLFKILAKKFKGYEVINFDFTAIRLSEYFEDIIFYYNDNFSSMSEKINPHFIAKYHCQAESEVARRAKFCIAVSDILRDKLLKFNPYVCTIPLGSPDIEEYNLNFNKDISKGVKIKAGLVGFVSLKNTSVRILNLLLKDPNVEVTLIGPVDDRFRGLLKNTERLTLTGPLIGKLLYEQINEFDIAISPYCEELVNDPNRGQATGNKLFQYLAVGKPVVMTSLQGVRNHNFPDGFIYIADNEDDFPALLYKAMEENNAVLRNRRIEYAKKNNWSERRNILIRCYDQFNKGEIN